MFKIALYSTAECCSFITHLLSETNISLIDYPAFSGYPYLPDKKLFEIQKLNLEPSSHYSAASGKLQLLQLSDLCYACH